MALADSSVCQQSLYNSAAYTRCARVLQPRERSSQADMDKVLILIGALEDVDEESYAIMTNRPKPKPTKKAISKAKAAAAASVDAAAAVADSACRRSMGRQRRCATQALAQLHFAQPLPPPQRQRQRQRLRFRAVLSSLDVPG